MKKPFCVAPFIEGFSGIDTDFRNCCAVNPQIKSLPNQSFKDWWRDDRLSQFRKEVTTTWHSSCQLCKIQEETTGNSFRKALNESVNEIHEWPQRWNLKFGNICNLGCWTCEEYSSSVIAHHKLLTNQLPLNFDDPQIKFENLWNQLEIDVLKSYNYYDVVTLTILGGEPLFNKTVISFLQKLVDLGLSKRTRLEFHTNGTKFTSNLFQKNVWNYLCVFISIDAIERKSEWLRYGSKWSNVHYNVTQFIQVADYTEIHCVLSILNINDLQTLTDYCKNLNLPLKISVLSSPRFFALESWDGNPKDLVNETNPYYNLIGTNSYCSAIDDAKNYIESFSTIRNSLNDYDPNLAKLLKIVKNG